MPESRVGRRDVVVELAPALRPHVAEQVGANRLVERHDGVAVTFVELAAHVAVQIVVERLHLAPEPVDLDGEVVGRHVVARAPHRADVGETELAGAFVGDLDHARVVGLHAFRVVVPLRPDFLELRGVAKLAHQHLGLGLRHRAAFELDLADAVGAVRGAS